MMSENTVDNLLARLAGRGGDSGCDAYAAVAAIPPDHTPPKAGAVQHAEKLRQDKLDQLLGRIAQLTSGATAAVNPTAVGSAPVANPAVPAAAAAAPAPPPVNEFFPAEPESFRLAKLTESDVEALSAARRRSAA